MEKGFKTCPFWCTILLKFMFFYNRHFQGLLKYANIPNFFCSKYTPFNLISLPAQNKDALSPSGRSIVFRQIAAKQVKLNVSACSEYILHKAAWMKRNIKCIQKDTQLQPSDPLNSFSIDLHTLNTFLFMFCLTLYLFQVILSECLGCSDEAFSYGKADPSCNVRSEALIQRTK